MARKTASKKKDDPNAEPSKAPKTRKRAERGNGGGDQIQTDLTPPVEDPGRAPQKGPENLGFKDRSRRHERGDPNAEPQGEDRVYGVESRARWNANAPSTQELNADAAEAERAAAGEE